MGETRNPVSGHHLVTEDSGKRRGSDITEARPPDGDLLGGERPAIVLRVHKPTPPGVVTSVSADSKPSPSHA